MFYIVCYRGIAGGRGTPLPVLPKVNTGIADLPAGVPCHRRFAYGGSPRISMLCFVGVPEDDFALGAGGGHIDNSLVARAAEHERDILLSFDKSSVHEHVDKVEDFLGDV